MPRHAQERPTDSDRDGTLARAKRNDGATGAGLPSTEKGRQPPEWHQQEHASAAKAKRGLEMDSLLPKRKCQKSTYEPHVSTLTDASHHEQENRRQTGTTAHPQMPNLS